MDEPVHALELGVPSTLVTTAVFARVLSGMKAARVRASSVLPGPTAQAADQRTAKEFIEQVRQALYASKICSYAQGFVQLQAAGQGERTGRWTTAQCAVLWRGGCIIRAQFLDRIKEAFTRQPQLENLLLHPYFTGRRAQGPDARGGHVVMTATKLGIPVPAFSTALAYYDGYRSERLPANLLQAQRDYFGAHKYQRVDQPGGNSTPTGSANAGRRGI